MLIPASRWARVRIAVCGVVLTSLFIAVGKRAFNLQVREADRLRAMAEEQYLREIELPPRRGRILDRNGADLDGRPVGAGHHLGSGAERGRHQGGGQSERSLQRRVMAAQVCTSL